MADLRLPNLVAYRDDLSNSSREVDFAGCARARTITCDPVGASALLRAAARIYDDPGIGLDVLARRLAPRGFAGGAVWMRAALSILRGEVPHGAQRSFQLLGLAKYTLPSLAALGVLVATIAVGSAWIAPLALLAFYVVEVRMVFAFPLALDGEERPLRASHRLVAAHHSALSATAIVMPIAAMMLVGGFFRRRFVRSWCLGCLAVLIWYEHVRARESGR